MPSDWLRLDRLRPQPAAVVDAAEEYAHAPGTNRVNMVASVDGAATLEGRVGSLTGPADQRLLLLLRALADTLVVGAGTLRAEGYGPLTVDPALAPLRTAAGQAPAPRLVVPTRTLDLDPEGPAFAEALEPPLVLTTRQAPADRVTAMREVAEVVVLGEDDLDLAECLRLVSAVGRGRVLCEGGPTLLGRLVAQGLVDELCLAVAPVVAVGRESRIAAGDPLPVPLALRLTRVCTAEEFLFLSYERSRATS